MTNPEATTGASKKLSEEITEGYQCLDCGARWSKSIDGEHYGSHTVRKITWMWGHHKPAFKALEAKAASTETVLADLRDMVKAEKKDWEEGAGRNSAQGFAARAMCDWFLEKLALIDAARKEEGWMMSSRHMTRREANAASVIQGELCPCGRAVAKICLGCHRAVGNCSCVRKVVE